MWASFAVEPEAAEFSVHFVEQELTRLTLEEVVVAEACALPAVRIPVACAVDYFPRVFLRQRSPCRLILLLPLLLPLEFLKGQRLFLQKALSLVEELEKFRILGAHVDRLNLLQSLREFELDIMLAVRVSRLKNL
jgi:hypothetical protein